MRIVVLGCGTVGGYFGGRLAAAGPDVSFVARGTTLAALQTSGLRVQSIKGNFELRVRATDDARKLAPADVVLVAVTGVAVESVC